jgi:predicted signal transduction protein with EAL and GGDEF domain
MQARSRVARKGKPKILVADNDLSAQRHLRRTLESAGFEIATVDNGRKALEFLLSKDGPRLALLDWLLPGLDGLKVCREIRRHSEHPYIYIIMLKAKRSSEDIVTGLEAGADDCLTKPFEPEELKARLRSGIRILKLEDKVAFDSLHDPLTHLPNRESFMERLSLCVSWGMGHPDYQFAVLSVDMDRFKGLNDSLGKTASDNLLVQVTNRLLGSIRRDDAMVRCSGNGEATGLPDVYGMLARLGGDKFSILLDHMRNSSEGIRVAERIQQNIQSPFLIDGKEVFTTVSIGIAYSATGYTAAEDMLVGATTAMSRAKALGRARYEVCDRLMHATAAGRLRLEMDLRRATERDEFRVHYQPIVSLLDGRIIGFEALLRWQRPGLGLVMPGGFISAAEETGLIPWIGNWILQEACGQICAWHRQFPRNPPFFVAVNISTTQFAQIDLALQIERLLSDSGIAPANLKLELTESEAMHDEQRAIRILGGLKDLGVSLCIDDFGTGYSSLSYLRRFPLDTMKIDRSFVSEMSEDSETREIVKTIMNLGNNLGMQVIAEGVETQKQVNLLKLIGCEFAQGYFFSRPLDAEGIAQTLRTAEAKFYALLKDDSSQLAITAR